MFLLRFIYLIECIQPLDLGTLFQLIPFCSSLIDLLPNFYLHKSTWALPLSYIIVIVYFVRFSVSVFIVLPHVITVLFPKNGFLCWLHNPGFQWTCHIIPFLRLFVLSSLEAYRISSFPVCAVKLLGVVGAHTSVALKLWVVSPFVWAVAGSTTMS
jgi:hypothetical protein